MTGKPFQPDHSAQQHALLSKVSKGDELAFRKLFCHYYPFLASHIFRITGSREITEEIVHDVFLKIWLTRETLAEIHDFKAYLVIVSRNHALNALRKIANDARQHQNWLTEVKQETGADPTDVYYSLIDEAIDQLTDRQKEIYLLHRHQRFSYEAIARRLQLSRETVKNHLQSATASITKYIRKKINTLPLILFILIFA